MSDIQLPMLPNRNYLKTIQTRQSKSRQSESVEAFWRAWPTWKDSLFGAALVITRNGAEYVERLWQTQIEASS